MNDIESAQIRCSYGVLARNLKIGGPLDFMRNTVASARRVPGQAITAWAAA
jgi:hypothetical protein